MFSPSLYSTSGPSLSLVKAPGTVQQNKAYFSKVLYRVLFSKAYFTKILYRILFSIILSFLFKHWSMNHVLPFLVCGASSEDSLPSGRFQHWKSLLDRRNETQRNNERCEYLFRSCYRGTLKWQKSQNKSCTQTSAAQILSSLGQWRDILWTEVHQVWLSCTDCTTSKSKWICCYLRQVNSNRTHLKQVITHKTKWACRQHTEIRYVNKLQ